MTYEPTEEDLKEMEEGVLLETQELTQSEKIGGLAMALAKARIEFKPLEQNGLIEKNYEKNGKWHKINIQYSTIADIDKATKHALQENCLGLLTQVFNEVKEAKVVTWLVWSKGNEEQFIKSVASTNVSVSGKQNFLSEFGKTLTYFARNIELRMLQVPTDDEEDPITEESDGAPRKRQPVKAKTKEELVSKETADTLYKMIDQFDSTPMEVVAYLDKHYNKAKLAALTAEEGKDLQARLANNRTKKLEV